MEHYLIILGVFLHLNSQYLVFCDPFSILCPRSVSESILHTELEIRSADLGSEWMILCHFPGVRASKWFLSVCVETVVFMRNRVDTVNAFEDKNIGFVKVCEVSDTVSLAGICLRDLIARTVCIQLCVWKIISTYNFWMDCNSQVYNHLQIYKNKYIYI